VFFADLRPVGNSPSNATRQKEAIPNAITISTSEKAEHLDKKRLGERGSRSSESRGCGGVINGGVE
jgi:hypothetical protein